MSDTPTELRLKVKAQREIIELQKQWLRDHGYEDGCICDSCTYCLSMDYINFAENHVAKLERQLGETATATNEITTRCKECGHISDWHNKNGTCTGTCTCGRVIGGAG